MTAQQDWAAALAQWAIPEVILARAPESPWTHSVGQFVRRAEISLLSPSRSLEIALQALPPGGIVLDVGCGAGAASLPLAERAGSLTGIDESPAMLEQFAALARACGVPVETLRGTWPDVAPLVGTFDVVVCSHVVYNVPELRSFVTALDRHARGRVVIELPAVHPLQRFNRQWLQFHALRRPERPTVADAMAVMREAGIEPSSESWQAPPGPWHARREDAVASLRRRLCLGADRDDEIAAVVDKEYEHAEDGRLALPGWTVCTVWWDRRSRA